MQLDWIAVHRDQAVFTSGDGPRLPEPPRRRTGGVRRRVLRRRARRPGPGPGRLFPDAGPPVAMGQQAHGDVRRRNRPAAHRPSRRSARTATRPSSPSGRSSTRSRPERYYVKTAHVGAEHGLHAGAVAAVHEGHPGHQRLAPRPDPRRRRPAAARTATHPRSRRRSATTTATTRPRAEGVTVPEDAVRAVAGKPAAAAGGRAAAGHHGVPAARRRARASRWCPR